MKLDYKSLLIGIIIGICSTLFMSIMLNDVSIDIQIGENNAVMLLGINGGLIVIIWKVNMVGIVQVAIVFMMKGSYVVMAFVMELKLMKIVH